jgi:PAS domain S-box-containing protein
VSGGDARPQEACPALSAEEAARLPLEELWERLRGADGASPPSPELARVLSDRHLEAARLVRNLHSRLLQEKEEQRVLLGELTRHEQRFTNIERAHRAGTQELQTQIERVRRTEAAQARLVSILEQTTDLVAIYDTDLRVQFVNRAGRAMLGAGAQVDLSGSTLADFHPAEVTARLLAEALPRAVAEGSWVGDSVLLGADGAHIPVSEMVLAHKDPLGAVEFYSTVGRDVSVYKEVDRLKSEFVSIVSHELRTPLTAIRGALGLLEGGVIGALSPEMGEMVGMARSNSERLIRLINDILDLDKIESGRMELHLGWFAPLDVVREIERELEANLREARLSLVVDVEPGLEVCGDRDRVAQVLINLIGNAAKFSPPGCDVRVTGRSARGGAAVRFEVEDSGPGIAKDQLPRLFRKFSQLDASDRRAKGGTGLGLSICKAIVEQHGGAIGVESEPGQGATFYFEIPVKSAIESGSQAAATALV